MKTIQKPIFIIGCARSGTSVLQHLMRFHPEIAYTTSLTSATIHFLTKHNLDIQHRFKIVRLIDQFLKNFPDSALPKILQGPADGFFNDDILPKAVEDWIIWNCYETGKDSYMDEKDVTPKKKEFIQKIILYHLEYFGAERFLSKNPTNSLRIRFINEIFPDSIFIHLLRDGRAVASSLLKHRKAKQWWSAKPIGWGKMLDEPLIVQSGWQWKTIVEIIEYDANRILDADQYIKVKYENLMEKPADTLQNIFEFCDLNYEKAQTRINRYVKQLESKNYKWKYDLTKEQKKLLLELIASKLKEYDYPDNGE